MVNLPARPAAVEVPPERTAVLVIDMQNDFGAPGGMFARAGIDISGIQAAAAATGQVLAAARAAGIPVVYLTMEHDPELANAGPAAGPHRIKHAPLGLGNEVTAPDGTPSRTLVRDTWSTAILDGLRPQDGDHVIAKHRYSGFFETRLDELLQMLEVTHLLVTGCTTSVCVESTVRDAMFRGYTTIVLEDCTAEPIGAGLARSNHEASLLVMELLFAWISTGAAVREALTMAQARHG